MNGTTLTGWALALAVVSANTTAASAQTAGDEHAPWNVDPAHTAVEFSVRHFFTPVRGSFQDYQIELIYDRENPANSSVNVVINVASVETNNQRRNNHLRTADFFDADNFPQITFRSSSVRRVSDSELIAAGILTIKETSVEVELPITVLGIMDFTAEMRERMGKARVASFQTGLEIDRRDFEVGTGSWAETAIVGADVGISIMVEASQ